MATMTAPVTEQKHIPGGGFLITDPTAADCFPRRFHRRAEQTPRRPRTCRQRSARLGQDRSEGLCSDQTLPGSSRAWPHRIDIPEEYGGRDGQGDVDDCRGEHSSSACQLLRARHRHAAAGLVRHRRAEAEVPARYRLRQDHLRLRALGIDQRPDAVNAKTKAVLSPDGKPIR